MHWYRLFGFAIRSEIALPELDPVAAERAADVEIRFASVAAATGSSSASVELIVTDGQAVLHVARVARFAIRDGREILIDPEPDAAAETIRLYLLGSAIAVLLHQRGALPLHANAIDSGEGAIAFLGGSGDGKSTLAAAFHDRGWTVLADDVCVLSESDGALLVQPGIPRLRLWRDAIERTGRAIDEHARVFHRHDKYIVRTPPTAPLRAVPPRAIYVLERHEGDGPFEIRRLSPPEALRALVGGTYRNRFVQLVGSATAHFETCLSVSRRVPMFELRRPWDSERIDETIALVEAHLATIEA